MKRTSKDFASKDAKPRRSTVRIANLLHAEKCLKSGIFRAYWNVSVKKRMLFYILYADLRAA